MQCCGKEIKWDHLTTLYKRDNYVNKIATGDSILPKINYEHVHLTNFSKIRINLATRVCICIHDWNTCTFSKVLSNQVAVAMKDTGDEDLTETTRLL